MRLECRSVRTGTAYAAHTTPKHIFNDRLISISSTDLQKYFQNILINTQ